MADSAPADGTKINPLEAAQGYNLLSVLADFPEGSPPNDTPLYSMLDNEMPHLVLLLELARMMGWVESELKTLIRVAGTLRDSPMVIGQANLWIMSLDETLVTPEAQGAIRWLGVMEDAVAEMKEKNPTLA